MFSIGLDGSGVLFRKVLLDSSRFKFRLLTPLAVDVPIFFGREGNSGVELAVRQLLSLVSECELPFFSSLNLFTSESL